MDFKNDNTIEKSHALWYNACWIIGNSVNGTAATLRISDSPGVKILILFGAIARQNYNLINSIPHLHQFMMQIAKQCKFIEFDLKGVAHGYKLQ